MFSVNITEDPSNTAWRKRLNLWWLHIRRKKNIYDISYTDHIYSWKHQTYLYVYTVYAKERDHVCLHYFACRSFLLFLHVCRLLCPCILLPTSLSQPPDLCFIKHQQDCWIENFLCFELFKGKMYSSCGLEDLVYSWGLDLLSYRGIDFVSFLELSLVTSWWLHSVSSMWIDLISPLWLELVSSWGWDKHPLNIEVVTLVMIL